MMSKPCIHSFCHLSMRLVLVLVLVLGTQVLVNITARLLAQKALYTHTRHNPSHAVFRGILREMLLLTAVSVGKTDSGHHAAGRKGTKEDAVYTIHEYRVSRPSRTD